MRLLLTLAVLLAGLLAGSYAVAPVPKEKNKPKTTAEKMIGNWKLIRLPSGNPPARGVEVTSEYKKDGKVIMRQVNRKGVLEVEEATYKVVGEIVYFTSDKRARPERRQWSVTVKEITDKKLVTLGPDSPPSEVEESVRIEPSDHK